MTAQRGSDKHGPRLDDQLDADVRPETRSGQHLRSQEWREPEPEGDDQAPTYPRGGPAPGVVGEDLSPQEVEMRSDLARHLDRGTFPADRDRLADRLSAHHAPDALVDAVQHLPADARYNGVDDVAHAMARGR
jgi:hypothetical protein